VVAAVPFFAKHVVFDGVNPSGIVTFPLGVEFVKFVTGKWGDTEERFEEDF